MATSQVKFVVAGGLVGPGVAHARVGAVLPFCTVTGEVWVGVLPLCPPLSAEIRRERHNFVKSRRDVPARNGH